MSESIQSVVLALRILENLTESSEEKGVTQLARELGTTKARVFRHLYTLRERGYVIQNEKSQKNRIGLRVFLLGRQVGEGIDVLKAVRPAMERLRDRTGQTAVLAGVLDGHATIIDFRMGTADPIQIGLRPGTTFELHATALGRVLLAFGPPSTLERALGGEMAKLTEHTVTDPATLRAQVAQVKKQGWSTAPEETFLGINALAAPVFFHDGGLAGALAIVGPVRSVPGAPDVRQLEELLHCSRGASRALGWRDG